MIIVPFELWHYELLEQREHERNTLQIFGDLNATLAMYARLSYAFSALDGGRIIGMAGVLPLWPGVGEAWLLGSPDLSQSRFYICKIIKHMLNIIKDNGKFHRIQATTKADFVHGKRFLEFFGFESEGTMRGYSSSKETFERYAITWLEQQ